MAKPILISGIQPSGKLHLGNYLGALKNFVSLQNSGRYQCFFFIADLHSLTEESTPKEKAKQIMELVADYLAVGLDPKKSTIFLQSSVPAHSELAWILNTITPMGELKRMTQFKDKGGEAETTNVGLFDYPVLMAADILLYDSQVVPVGDDQLQHLELARTLARKFNSKFGKTFVEPKPLLTEIPRVMSLDAPDKKMSKSRPGGCVFLDDSPEEIKEKVKRAVTDSESVIRYDAKNKPAISNLMRLYGALSGDLMPDLEKKFQNMNYSELKLGLANTIANYFAPFRAKKAALRKQPKIIEKVLKAGNAKAQKIAAKKIEVVKKKIGVAK
ncbi:MAG: tryptophanyl-tRNA synthetase [Parcubacteria group bacterium LiPW_15]|nr:MAG: tryptophanyl-tRNA synthetase [Parcubacteria group bacterium LiPW_15]